MHSGTLDFSFAGLKTAVLTQVQKLGDDLQARKADLAAATQAAGQRLVFAGEHLAQESSGMEAALESGERAAQTILTRY